LSYGTINRNTTITTTTKPISSKQVGVGYRRNTQEPKNSNKTDEKEGEKKKGNKTPNKIGGKDNKKLKHKKGKIRKKSNIKRNKKGETEYQGFVT
jgi:hypothetical protein